jgi:DinB superfamily
MLTDKWTQQIEKTTQAFLDTFGKLSKEPLNYKPSPQVWSIAQNIHHLIVINETYFPVLDSLKRNDYKLPWIARINFLVNFFGKVVLSAVNPDRRKKMKTFPIWEPSSSDFEMSILNDFKDHQQKLKQYIINSKELLEQGVVISSPANRNIVYKLDKAFDIIVTHELRHLEQAKELLPLLK